MRGRLGRRSGYSHDVLRCELLCDGKAKTPRPDTGKRWDGRNLRKVDAKNNIVAFHSPRLQLGDRVQGDLSPLALGHAFGGKALAEMAKKDIVD